MANLSDLDIARSIKLKHINEIGTDYGFEEDELELHGKYMAKVNLDVLKRLKDIRKGHYVNVTALTPTPLGEGKTVTTVGLGLALNSIGVKTLTTIRQPSLGPVFGIKGGAAGGGYSQVVPMEDFNLHLTGDNHAVSLAHNLCSAFVDNSIHQGNPLNIDPRRVEWTRVVDVSDRALRNVVIGLGKRSDGVPRQSNFDIAVASEVMAILGLATDIFDLRRRLGKVVVAYDYDRNPITAEDLKVAGAMTVLLKDTLKPTLMQTTEGTGCLVHTGPFANIAHGNSSVLADMVAERVADMVVTESGFGSDMGCEKLYNIKSRVSGMSPDATVMVATVRALKMHSGKFRVIAGKPLDEGLLKPDPSLVEEGAVNLRQHIRNVKAHGVPCVVAINAFPTDSEEEYDVIRKVAEQEGAYATEVSRVWAKGSEGGRELAEAVKAACESGESDFRFLYDLEQTLEEKIERIATTVYGADGVEYEAAAKRALKRIKASGHDKLPVCMAKTHLSLSHDPKLKGAPKDFTVPVRDIRLSAGAGFVYPLLGEMRTMPGLPSKPAGENVDIDENGLPVGLF